MEESTDYLSLLMQTMTWRSKHRLARSLSCSCQKDTCSNPSIMIHLEPLNIRQAELLLNVLTLNSQGANPRSKSASIVCPLNDASSSRTRAPRASQAPAFPIGPSRLASFPASRFLPPVRACIVCPQKAIRKSHTQLTAQLGSLFQHLQRSTSIPHLSRSTQINFIVRSSKVSIIRPHPPHTLHCLHVM